MPRGTIRKRTTREGTSYQVRVHLEPDPGTGKQREWVRTFHTRREAERARAAYLVELEQGTAVQATRISVAEWMESWLQTYAAHHVRPKTLEDYGRTIALHIVPHIGGLQVQRLTPLRVQQLYSDLLTAGKGPRTVEQAHQRLCTALEQAVQLGIVPQNVARRATPPRVPRTPREVWTVEQARAFLRVAQGGRYGPLWLVLLTTGMRRGEVLGLRWRDVEWDINTLRVRESAGVVNNRVVAGPPKTESSRRSIPVPVEVMEALRAHRVAQMKHKMWLGAAWQDHDLVFCTDVGTYIQPKRLRDQLIRYAKEAGVPVVRIHDLRHHHVAALLQAGADVKEVAQRVGHSSTKITLDVYHHVSQSQRDASVQRIRAAYFSSDE